MKDFRNRSKERLEGECLSLLKDLMVSCLDRAEKILRVNKHGGDWKQFRFEILNLGNANKRLMQDKFEDYEIEFRPQIIFSVKYISDSERNDMADMISKFNFYFLEDGQPGLRIQLAQTDANEELLKKIWESVRCGVVVNYENSVFYEASGLFEMFDSVIPFFDSNKCFRGKVLEEFNKWKEKVYKLEAKEKGAGNVR